MKIQLASLPKQPYCVVGALEDVEFNVGRGTRLPSILQGENGVMIDGKHYVQ